MRRINWTIILVVAALLSLLLIRLYVDGTVAPWNRVPYLGR